MTIRKICLCDLLPPILKHLPPPPVAALPNVTPLSAFLTFRCSSPSPILKGTPMEYHLGHSKIVAIFKTDHFDFFSRIWKIFWWGITRRKVVTGGMNGNIKIWYEQKPYYLNWGKTTLTVDLKKSNKLCSIIWFI